MIVLNDLYDYGLKIYQDDTKFKFSLDSLLLAEYIDIPKNAHNLLDLCTGNAPLPLILAKKTNLAITGIEIQKSIYDLAKKSIKENHLEDRITLYNMNASCYPDYFPGNNFDIITCNPPFFKYQKDSLINLTKEKAIARHELTITLKEIFQIVKNKLKDNGTFYLVHRPDRLEEIFELAHTYHLACKKVTFIYSNIQDYAIMVLFKFVKNAHLGTKVTSLVINENTKTYQNIFKRR